MTDQQLNQHDGNALPPVAAVAGLPPQFQSWGSVESTTGTAEDPIAPQLVTTRTRTDTVWGVLFAALLLVWFTIGFAIIGSHNTGVMTGGRAACTERFPSTLTSEPKVECICAGKTEDICVYHPAPPKDCPGHTASGGRRLFAHHRRLDSKDTSWDVFSIFTHFPGYPFVLILLTAIIAVSWVAALKKWARPLIHATALLKPAAFVLCAIVFLRDGASTGPVCVLLVIAAAFLFLYAKYRAKYDLSARVMTASCESLSESKGVWRVACGIQVLFLVLLAFYVWTACQTFNIMAWSKDTDTNGNDRCTLEPARWAISAQRFMAAMYLWVLFFANGARLVAVSTSAVTWFFHSDDPTKLANPAQQGAKWAFTSSFGTIALGSLLVALSYQIKKSAQSRVAWGHPIGCALKFFFHYLHKCIEALTKFCLIVHVFTGEPFCKSVTSTFNLLKRRFASAIIVDMAAEDCLRLGAYTFSIMLGCIAWAWADSLCETETLKASTWAASNGVLLYVLLALFGLLTYYPMLTLFMVSLVAPFVSSNHFANYYANEEAVSMAKQATPPMVAMFIGALCHIIFGFMAKVLLDTVDTVFLCWAIDKDYRQCGFGGAQTLTDEQQEKHAKLYVVLAESDAGKAWISSTRDRVLNKHHTPQAEYAAPAAVSATAVEPPSAAAVEDLTVV